MKSPRDVSFEETLLPMLVEPAEAAAYIEAVLELDDPATVLVALRHVTKAHGNGRGSTAR